MRKLTQTLWLAAIALMLTVGSAAYAGEALEPLRGEWLVESWNGEQLPPEMKMTINFVDDDTLSFTATMNGEVLETEEVRYTASEDGNMTVYTEEEPDGEAITWAVGEDKKLTLSSEEDGDMVLKRPDAE